MKIPINYMLSIMLAFASCPFAYTMEQSVAIDQIEEQPKSAVKTLKALALQRLSGNDVPLAHAENRLCPDLKEELKLTLIYDNLLLFLKIFQYSTPKILGLSPRTENTEWGLISISPDCRHALIRVPTMKQQAVLWDLTLENQTPLVIDAGSPIWSMEFGPDGRCAMTGSENGTVHLWDLTKKPITSEVLHGHTNRIVSIAFTLDGTSALTRSFCDTILLWDLRNNPITHTLFANREHVRGTGSLGTNHSQAITSNYLGASNIFETAIWDLRPVPRIKTILPNNTGQYAAAISPDGKYAIICQRDGMICRWNLAENSVRQIWGFINEDFDFKRFKSKDYASSIKFSCDSKYAFARMAQNNIRIWYPSADTDSCNVAVFSKEPSSFATISSNGRYGLEDASDGKIRLWDFFAEPLKLTLTELQMLIAAKGNPRLLCKIIQWLDLPEEIKKHFKPQSEPLPEILSATANHLLCTIS